MTSETAPWRASSPCTGLNSEVAARGRVFHVQTEDMGLEYRSVVTHVFCGGQVTESRRSSYPRTGDKTTPTPEIVALMKSQHDETMRSLQSPEPPKDLEMDVEVDRDTLSTLSFIEQYAEQLPAAPAEIASPWTSTAFEASSIPPTFVASSDPMLEILDGDRAGDAFRLDRAQLKIGRSPTCDIQLSDPTVASVHCIMVRDRNAAWRLTCLDAQSELRVDGARTRSHTFSSRPQMVEIGRIRLRFAPTALPIPPPVPNTADLILPSPPSSSELTLIPGGVVNLRGRSGAAAPFLLQRTPVTNRQFLDFLDDSGRPLPEHWLGARPPSMREDHPVVGVTWEDARAYAKWRGMRLPTVSEWLAACFGREGRRFPWGEEWGPNRSASRESGATGTVPVLSFADGKSPEGCLHLLGNVWEWTDGDDLGLGADPGSVHALGGAFSTGIRSGAELPSAEVNSTKAYDYLGFRCASDLEV